MTLFEGQYIYFSILRKYSSGVISSNRGKEIILQYLLVSVSHFIFATSVCKLEFVHDPLLISGGSCGSFVIRCMLSLYLLMGGLTTAVSSVHGIACMPSMGCSEQHRACCVAYWPVAFQSLTILCIACMSYFIGCIFHSIFNLRFSWTMPLPTCRALCCSISSLAGHGNRGEVVFLWALWQCTVLSVQWLGHPYDNSNLYQFKLTSTQ